MAISWGGGDEQQRQAKAALTAARRGWRIRLPVTDCAVDKVVS
jgi:hypothetical protein